jgi:hypothetical protein
MRFVFIEDSYSKNRGKYSRIIDIYCRKCKNHVGYYQKDGGTKNYMGQLRRVYTDRFLDKPVKDISKKKELNCSRCKEVLGTRIRYTKEKRTAFRLYVGAVKYKIMQTKDKTGVKIR